MSTEKVQFVTFFDAACALNFFQHATVTNLTINSRRLKIGWGKHSGPVSPALSQAVLAGASRNVYIGSISDFNTFNEEKLRQDFSEFGGESTNSTPSAWFDRWAEIEMINFLREKSAAFVNL